MSSVPPPPSTPSSLSRLASKTPLVGLFTLGAFGVTAMMMKDSFNGSRDRMNQKLDEIRESNDWNYAEYGWGHWSGMPWMDKLAHKLQGLGLYGPFGLKEKFQGVGVRMNTFMNDVLWPNLIPLGISIAGLYGTFGAKAIHGKIGGAMRWITQGAVSKPVKQAFGSLFRGIGRGLSSILGRVGKWAFFTSPANFAIASGLTFLGAFFLKRFHDAYGHDGQRAFFRDEVYNRHDIG